MYIHTKKRKMATLELGLQPRQFVDLETVYVQFGESCGGSV